MIALNEQVGGDHYKNFPIQPEIFSEINGLSFDAGNIIKYVCRYQIKGGLQDLEKAKSYIEKLISHETIKEQVKTSNVCDACFQKHRVAKTFGYDFLNCECSCHKKTKEKNFLPCVFCFPFHYEGGEIVEFNCICKCHKEEKDV